MRLALMLTPMSDHHLRLAAQVGAGEIVAPYPGTDPDELLRLRDRVGMFGLRLTVIERGVPHAGIVHGGPRAAEQLDGIRQLIRNMGRAGVRTLCYNWMPDDDWSRTSVSVRERGGALVTEFDLASAGAEDQTRLPSGERRPSAGSKTPAQALWRNLGTFLHEIVPVAEDAGVALALHPDDPPLSRFRGQDRIITSVAACERAAALRPSPSNGICFCQGTFASAGEDIVPAIQTLAPHIRFVHFRDVVGTVPHFRESFHDNGQTNMAAAMRAYAEAGLDVPIRPDHVPTLDGEDNSTPGYHMLGRLFAVGYMRGLIHGLDEHAGSRGARAGISAGQRSMTPP
jgi:mannonate dehydratase